MKFAKNWNFNKTKFFSVNFLKNAFFIRFITCVGKQTQHKKDSVHLNPRLATQSIKNYFFHEICKKLEFQQNKVFQRKFFEKCIFYAIYYLYREADTTQERFSPLEPTAGHPIYKKLFFS